MKSLIWMLVLEISLLSHLAFPMAGGEPAKGAWPEVVAIQWGQYFAGSSPTKCSATIVGPNMMITAAHCVHGLAKGDILTINQFAQNAGGKTFRVRDVQSYPEYVHDSTQILYWDVGYIVLDGVDLGNEFKIKDYPKVSHEKLSKPEELTAVGLGLSSKVVMQKDRDNPTSKRFASLNFYGRDKDLMVLSSHNGTSPCSGDSGGGIFRVTSENHTLVAVMVVEHGSCDGKGYTAAHDLGYSIGWMESNLGSKL